jgi:hypothetical protein
MKLRYLILALLSLMTATTLTAQTMTATAVAAKAKTARSVYRDVRSRNIHRAATTVMNDKDISSRVKIDKDLQSRLADPQLVTNLRHAPAELRKNPVAFAKKNEKTLRELKKHRPKWLGGKSKKRTAHKK